MRVSYSGYYTSFPNSRRGSDSPRPLHLTVANFKRKRRKNARAGCLLCKPWKANGCKHPKATEKAIRLSMLMDAREELGGSPR